jgi:uncharacterized membrane protein
MAFVLCARRTPTSSTFRGGEKFLDSAPERCPAQPYLPPADAWFAGGTSNYYWGPPVATVIRLTASCRL